MIRLAVSVEGQTEEEFVKRVLAVHLRGRRIESTPIVLGRARSRVGGGNVSVDRLVSEVVALFGSFDAVTTLVDFYGFKDKGDKAVQELEVELLDGIAERVGGDWNAGKVVPYVQRHEFEGVLFSDVDALATQIDLGAALLRRRRTGPLGLLAGFWERHSEEVSEPSKAWWGGWRGGC